jgi:hypothetical protein
MDAAISSNKKMDAVTQKIKSGKHKPFKTTRLLLMAAFKYNKFALLEAIMVFLVCEASFIAIAMLAIQGAISSPLKFNQQEKNVETPHKACKSIASDIKAGAPSRPYTELRTTTNLNPARGLTHAVQHPKTISVA